MNNKAEGRISTLTYTVGLALLSLMLFSFITLELSKSSSYNFENIKEFDDYKALSERYTNESKRLKDIPNAVKSEDGVLETVQETTDDGFFQNAWNKIKGSYQTAKDTIQTAWLDSWIRAAASQITKFFKMIGIATGLINSSVEQTGLQIPPIVKTFIFGLFGITVAILFIRARYERKF